MKFELGKFYRHNAGEEISIVGIVETTLYGTCYAAESNKNFNLKVISMKEDDGSYGTLNWNEITKEQWMRNFSKV